MPTSAAPRVSTPAQTLAMNRRAFVTGLGAVLAAPGAIEAQQAGKVPRVGILWPIPPAATKNFRDAFVHSLRELGRVEGKTIFLEERYSNGRDELLNELAANLVAVNVDAIVTVSER